MTLTSGNIFIDRYRIVRLPGQGGFGAVYQAWDLTLERPCAIKESLDTTQEALRQFKREARLLANLAHPNLPRVTDYLSIPGQGQYLEMDFVGGQDLQELLVDFGIAKVYDANLITTEETHARSHPPNTRLCGCGGMPLNIRSL